MNALMTTTVSDFTLRCDCFSIMGSTDCRIGQRNLDIMVQSVRRKNQV